MGGDEKERLVDCGNELSRPDTLMGNRRSLWAFATIRDINMCRDMSLMCSGI